ncbi:hypothetical protein Dimus_020555 [Dionaea muscipula]
MAYTLVTRQVLLTQNLSGVVLPGVFSTPGQASGVKVDEVEGQHLEDIVAAGPVLSTEHKQQLSAAFTLLIPLEQLVRDCFVLCSLPVKFSFVLFTLLMLCGALVELGVEEDRFLAFPCVLLLYSAA